MLARVSSHGAVPESGILRRNAPNFGVCTLPSLRKCARIRRISAIADESSPGFVKEGNTGRKIQNYPVSFSIYHNVQDGDTMTSIAREYNTSMRSIALANKIEDVNLLQTGQILQVPVQPRVFQKVTALVLQDTPENTSTSEQEAVSNVVQQQTSAPIRPWANSGLRSFVKFTAPLLLMVPVIALCVRGLVEVANQRIKLEVSRTQAEKEVWDAQHRPKLKRWQNILEGDRESDVLPIDAQLETTESETEEERKKREEDELRKSYEELEATYMKFLADSGLSRSGYWRGGIPSSG